MATGAGKNPWPLWFWLPMAKKSEINGGVDNGQKPARLIAEYGHCLDRIAGEKDAMKAIELRAKTECDPAVFRAVATAIWKDETGKVRDDCQEKLDLLEKIEKL